MSSFGVMAALGWIHPGVLWAVAACAAPIVIHLLLRPRSRRQPFPAVRFLLQTHVASVRRHRLRHLLLLLLRALAVGLLVAALARPVLRGSTAAGPGRGPVAAAVCIDDSASMGYRVGDGTRLGLALERATRLVADDNRFPDGSVFTVLRSSDGRASGWLKDRVDVRDAIRAIEAPGGDRPLADAIDTALRRLGESTLPLRELYVVTDMTRRAWDGVAAVHGLEAASMDVYVSDVGSVENRNASVGPPTRLRTRIQPGIAQTTSVTVTCADLPLSDRLSASIDGRVVARSRPFSLQPGESATVPVVLPALEPGVHAGAVKLDTADGLDADNAWFFAIEVSPPGRIVVVQDEPTDQAGFTEADRIEAMLAPPTMPETRRPVTVVSVQGPSAGESLESALAGECTGVVLFRPDLPGERVRRAVASWLERGGRLLVIGGEPRPTETARMESVLAAVPEADVVEIDPRNPERIEWAESGGPSETAATLARAAVYRHLRLRLLPGARVVASFCSGLPAIIERPVGRGRTTNWAFSTDPRWSDLGIRAAAAIPLLHHTFDSAPSGSPRTASIGSSEGGTLNVGRDGPSRLRLTAAEGTRAADMWLDVGSEGEAVLPAGLHGAYLLTSDAQNLPVAVVAANLSPDETNGKRIDPAGVTSLFAGGSTQISSEIPPAVATDAMAAVDHDLLGWVVVILIGALLMEAYLARRAAGAA